MHTKQEEAGRDAVAAGQPNYLWQQNHVRGEKAVIKRLTRANMLVSVLILTRACKWQV